MQFVPFEVGRVGRQCEQVPASQDAGGQRVRKLDGHRSREPCGRCAARWTNCGHNVTRGDGDACGCQGRSQGIININPRRVVLQRPRRRRDHAIDENSISMSRRCGSVRATSDVEAGRIDGHDRHVFVADTNDGTDRHREAGRVYDRNVRHDGINAQATIADIGRQDFKDRRRVGMRYGGGPMNATTRHHCQRARAHVDVGHDHFFGINANDKVAHRWQASHVLDHE